MTSSKIGICFAFIVTGLLFCNLTGCVPSSDPVLVEGTVVQVNEADNNKTATFSGGMYQQFYDVKFDIVAPPEQAGKYLNARIETRMLGESKRILETGTRMEFLINPRLMNRSTPCTMDDLKGYQYLDPKK